MKTDSEKLDTIYKWVCSQAGYDDPRDQLLRIGNLEIYLHDLPEAMTYVDTLAALAKVNAETITGKPAWRIPTLEELRVLYKNKDKIGGFCTEDKGGSGYPDWYWSSTEDRDDSSGVHNVRFSDGDEGWSLKDNFRLSCRPVRLVAAPSLG